MPLCWMYGDSGRAHSPNSRSGWIMHVMQILHARHDNPTKLTATSYLWFVEQTRNRTQSVFVGDHPPRSVAKLNSGLRILEFRVFRGYTVPPHHPHHPPWCIRTKTTRLSSENVVFNASPRVPPKLVPNLTATQSGKPILKRVTRAVAQKAKLYLENCSRNGFVPDSFEDGDRGPWLQTWSDFIDLDRACRRSPN